MEQLATRQPNNGTTDNASEVIAQAPALELVVDVDNLTVDGFIRLLEIQEQMVEDVKAAHVRAMIELLAPCVTNVDVSGLPFRHLQRIMETVIGELSEGSTASGN